MLNVTVNKEILGQENLMNIMAQTGATIVSQEGDDIVLGVNPEQKENFVKLYDDATKFSGVYKASKFAGSLIGKTADLGKKALVGTGQLAFKTTFGVGRRCVETVAGLGAKMVKEGKESYSQMIDSDEFNDLRNQFGGSSDNGLSWNSVDQKATPTQEEILEEATRLNEEQG